MSRGRNMVDRWFRLFGAKVRNVSKYQPHQGDRECARRRGEIGWQARRWLS